MAKVLITLISWASWWCFICCFISVLFDIKQFITHCCKLATAISSLTRTCDSLLFLQRCEINFCTTKYVRAMTTNGGRKLLAVSYKLFYIEKNRKEAEKSPSTCSSNQSNQYFSHLVYCDTLPGIPYLIKFRTMKCLGQLHVEIAWF